MNPPRTWSRVLLPHPLGPTTVTNSPSATARRARSSTSRVRPSRAYAFRSPTTSSAGALISGRLAPRGPGEQTLEGCPRPLGRPAFAPDTTVAEPAGQLAGELALLADLARQPDDRLHPPLAAHDVARQGLPHVRLAADGPRQLLGEDGGIFHRHTRALAHVRCQGVGRVAQERHAAASPGGLANLFDVGAHDAIGRRELAERPLHPPVGELAEQASERRHALERPRATLQRRIERRPHVELTAADRDEPDALAVSEELGEMLEPAHVGHDKAMRSVAEVHGLVRSEELRAHRGSNPVGADQDLGAEDLAALGLDAYPVLAGLERDDACVEMDGAGRQAVVQALVQVRPVTQRPDREASLGVERAVVPGRQLSSTVVEGVAREVGRAS